MQFIQKQHSKFEENRADVTIFMTKVPLLVVKA